MSVLEHIKLNIVEKHVMILNFCKGNPRNSLASSTQQSSD